MWRRYSRGSNDILCLCQDIGSNEWRECLCGDQFNASPEIRFQKFGKCQEPFVVLRSRRKLDEDINIAIGTVLTEALNYTFFKYVADLKVLKKMLESRSVQKAVRLFNRAPFLALWVAGFTPIPFYPFRFLVVLARYPVVKYLLAVILSRVTKRPQWSKFQGAAASEA